MPPRAPHQEAAARILISYHFIFITGLTDKMRNDFNVMKDLAVHTRLPPDQRERQVGKFLNYIHKDESVQNELRDWGLNFDTELLQFEGRIAPLEKILQKDRSAQYNPQFADWSRELRGPVLISARDLNNWLLFYTRRNYDAANALVQNLFKITQQMHIKMNRAVLVEVEDTVGGYLQAFQQNITHHTEMVVCILSSINKMKYDAIKKHLCVDFPIPSQCVVARTLSKPQTVLSVCTKIALQMNCKLGGELWTVEMPLDKAIIIGIDCYHDTLQGRRSIAGFVASTNKEMTRWFSRCVVQDQRQEIVDGLKVCMQGWAASLSQSVADLTRVSQTLVSALDRLPLQTPAVASGSQELPREPSLISHKTSRQKRRSESSSRSILPHGPPLRSASPRPSSPESGEALSDAPSEDISELDSNQIATMREMVQNLIGAVNQSCGIKDPSTEPADQAVSFRRAKPPSKFFAPHPEFEEIMSRERENPTRRFQRGKRLGVLYPFSPEVTRQLDGLSLGGSTCVQAVHQHGASSVRRSISEGL
ncbi:unnamed protein product [Ranitomeya imitator]|uniref:Piwi domain-containing protein n=1 Tax=Ranitomeya imitator TaxID=111125 RepID=A0ABN9L3T1_9NEOB|nr:unnamed protein product [Ranitomeya imitator]